MIGHFTRRRFQTIDLIVHALRQVAAAPAS
jgi:hypothetical protein